MSVPAIALYASPPSGVCSTHHHSCQITASHSSTDLDLNPRSAAPAASSSAASSAAAAVSQKPIVGGLSRIFSSTAPAAAASRHVSASGFVSTDELGSFRHDRSDDLGSLYSYSLSSSPFKCREHSPVSVFQGPVTCSRTGSSKSPPLARTPREWMGGDWRTGKDRLFKGFIRNALSPCLVYDSPSFSTPNDGTVSVEELPFGLDDSMNDTETTCEPYARELLAGAQARHKIFHEEIVLKAFYEAEKAHKGQEFPADSTVFDLMERAGEGSSRGSPSSFPVKLELRPRLNHEPVSDPSRKLRMGDVVELTPALPDKSLTEYREEIQRMYERGLALSGRHG
ncbi:hypothetical protein BHM03_00045346 [Ensete ventricosum]|nr:hypothetical protein BHM03_00045346 [Ensete ventricosum]